MRICIIETGAPPPPLQAKYGTYSQMFAAMLQQATERFRFTTVNVAAGESPPDLTAADAFLYTGSAAGVYEDHAWIKTAEAFVQEAARAQKPQAGICFGHQLMAQSFGGRVEKSLNGWGVGNHAYNVCARELDG